jgi:uncharacterized membrane protein YeiH
MVLVLLAVSGFLVGYRLGMTPAGYVTMALTTLGFSAGQIVDVSIAQSPESVTLLPLVVGLVLVVSMLIGAFLRLAFRGRYDPDQPRAR